MLLVCGPRLLPESFDAPPGVEAGGYVPDLYKHFAASDLAIVQGGGSSTIELTALRRPFIYSPLKGHSEQQINVSRRHDRLGAGIRMRYPKTTPELLAETVRANIGKDVTYPPISTDGAARAARLIAEFPSR